MCSALREHAQLAAPGAPGHPVLQREKVRQATARINPKHIGRSKSAVPVSLVSAGLRSVGCVGGDWGLGHQNLFSLLLGLADGALWGCSPAGKAIYRNELAEGSQAPVPWSSVATHCTKKDLIPPWELIRACPACIDPLHLP